MVFKTMSSKENSWRELFSKVSVLSLKTHLSGSINNSDWVKLDKEWYDDFQRGKNDTYVLSFQRALGTIIGIDLKKEGWIGTGLDAWKCSKEYFEIENVEKGLEQLFWNKNGDSNNW